MSNRYLCTLKGRPDLIEEIYQLGAEEAAEAFLDILYTEKRLPEQEIYTVFACEHGALWTINLIKEISVIHRSTGIQEYRPLQPGEDLRDNA